LGYINNYLKHICSEIGSLKRVISGTFSDYTESTFEQVVDTVPSFTTIKHWKTHDVRPNRKDEYWLNVLLKKRGCSEFCVSQIKS